MDFPKLDLTGNLGPQTARTRRERQLEQKRARGEVSCAECHRLKLKCDKKVPCSSCLRRGCLSVCPNGSLATVHGTSKYILANTDKLHRKLLEMSRRIRQLEDALQIAQLSLSATPHPLLSDELLKIKTGVDAVEEAEKDAVDDEILPNVGTLTITEHGEARFVGRTEAMVESVMHEVSSQNRSQSISTLLAEVAFLTEAFPFAPTNLPKRKILKLISERLPSYERATSLVQAYLTYLSCFFRPVERQQIMEELLPRYYKHREEAFAEDEKGVSVHQLALLLAVFASGAAGDLSLEAQNNDGEIYRHLARCALSLHDVFEGTSVCTVQAVSLVSSYDCFSALAQARGAAWKLQSLALCLALSIGLHWDPSSWNMPPKFAQRRRSLFWELYTLNNWKSLGSGRPPILRLHEADCRYPEDSEATNGKDGQTLHSFYHWKYNYAKQVVATVAATFCTVRPIKYSEILELDRKVREYPGFPTEYFKNLNAGETSDVFQTFESGLYKEISLIFIHRSFFVRALRENPKNPIRSRFGPSFLAAYASATSLLRSTLRKFEYCRSILLRVWPFWAHTLVAGVIVGSVAARDNSELSRVALKDLELAIGLFEKAVDHPVPKNGLQILLRLRDKARSYSAERNSLRTTIGANGSPTSALPASAIKVEPIDEALLMLSGETKFVRMCTKCFGSSAKDTMGSPSRANSSPTPPDSDNNTANAAVGNAPTDTLQLLQSLGVNSNATGFSGLESDDVYTWLFGRAVSRANEGESYIRDRLSPTSALPKASGAELGGELQADIPAVQQQKLQFVSGSETDADPDNLASWGLQNAFNSQATTAQGTSGGAPQPVQMGPESLGAPLDPNAAASYTDFSDAFWSSTAGFNAPASMVVDTPFGFDFDVEGMGAPHGNSDAYSQLGSGDDTIEDAWRSIIEDPRFKITEPNPLFSYQM